MFGRRGEARPAVRWQGRRALAASLAVLGLLLFTWPFVRTPLLGIGASYAHFLGAWALFVVALAALARSLGRRDGAGGAGDA
ncbi:MAG TPA: hypothetical protein VF912_09735 [Anaeromyxobacter sp.]